MVEDVLPSIKINMDAMITLDSIFAKAKLSMDQKANCAELTTERKIKIVNGRHPLLNQNTCVPLTFEIGDGIRGVIITGPNTGGKTVALKTVGLLSMMAQCGLHVPADPGSIFSLHNLILCDIGDGQSISENLSTFSSHITNVIHILEQASEESFVLLDELGSGTDPAEGMGIAISILEELRHRHCLFVATTHYPEVKDYALSHDGVINARMTFDRESLRPNYRLEIGEAGESCALYIAKRLGFPAHLLKIAEDAAYHGKIKVQDYKTDKNFKKDTKSPKVEKNYKQAKNYQTKQLVSKKAKFQIGDSVFVYPKKEIGIIYQTVNVHGELGVQIKGKKQLISYKRLKLNVPASELYPENYDFSTIFDTVANRKAKHKMDRKQRDDLVIDYESNKNLSKYKNI